MQLNLIEMILCQDNEADADTENSHLKQSTCGAPFLEYNSHSCTRQKKETLDESQDTKYFN